MTEQHIYDAVILGAGYGGLGIAAELTRHNVDNFIVLERGTELGGVWRDNVYPGAACDTQSLIYCYSYFLHTQVTRLYAGQQELLSYLQRFAAEFDLNRRIQLETEVTSASWDTSHVAWTVETTNGQYLGRTFIPAWGQLGAPLIPDIPGRSRFTGPQFHSARWRPDVDLTGLRVASVGAAASAVQYVPEVAKVAGRLTVFQRSANYVMPRDQRIFTAAERAEFVAHPEIYAELRRQIHEQREIGFERIRHDTAAKLEGIGEAAAHLESQITDPILRAKLTPDYEFGCKRILRSDEYYPALNRPNVALETDPIDHITPDAIMTRNGTVYKLDVIIYGTGFRSQAFNDTVTVRGRRGLTLDERWGNAPEAFLGLTVDGFPNLFLMYGPNTNLNHHSIVAMLELQAQYVTQAVREIVATPGQALEVRPQRLRDFNEWLQDELRDSAFTSECSSWYKNEDGKVINNWCGTVEAYRVAVAELNLDDYSTAAPPRFPGTRQAWPARSALS